MYHSVYFGDMNSYSDWHLVPDKRPVVAMPTPKATLIDVPGASGSVDLSEYLTKYPVYQNRKGTMRFNVLNGYEDWVTIHDKIADYLHGKRLRMRLEDDPNYYYEGRFFLKEWISNNNGTWSDIDIDYEVDPYKYSITDSSITASVNGSNEINVNSGNKLGRMPVVPTIKITGVGDSGVTLSLTNAELGISNLARTFSTNGTYKDYSFVLSAIKANNLCAIALNGVGTVNLTFRKGEL